MFLKIVLGALAAAAIVKLIHHRRWHRGWHGGWHGCRFHRGWGWRHGRAFFFHRIGRHLDLDENQRSEVERLVREVHDVGSSLHSARRKAAAEAVAAAVREPLDPAELDAVADRFGAQNAEAARGVARALGRLHQILSPEQRAKLRDLLDRFGPFRNQGFSAGPYR